MKAGHWLGDTIKTYTGFGAYTVNSNVLYEGAQAPFIRNYDVTNGTVIAHREYLGDIHTSSTAGAFSIESYAVNPGMSPTFEFLAQMAANYEQYAIEGLIFTFRSMAAESTNSNNIALGTVIMAADYSVNTPGFTSKAEMEASQYAMSCKPSESMHFPVECDPSQTPVDLLYIRTGSIPANSDLRLYDHCNMYIATQGFQGTGVNIGELWVSYQVALLKPRMWAALGNTIDYFTHKSTLANAVAFFPSNNGVPSDSSSTINLSIVSLSSTKFRVVWPYAYPQPTTYFCLLDIYEQVTPIGLPIITIDGFSETGAIAVFDWYQNIFFETTPQDATNTRYTVMWYVKFYGGYPRITPRFDVTNATAHPNTAYMRLTVIQRNNM